MYINANYNKSLSDDYRIFVGDLGNEVTDDTLVRAFNKLVLISYVLLVMLLLLHIHCFYVKTYNVCVDFHYIQ